MNLRVLIVEDNPAQLDHLALQIRKLDKAQRAEVGIDEVEITKAADAAKARQLLQAAVHSATPYDLMLLDLALPEGQAVEKPERGLELLRIAREHNAAREIIIVSAFLGFEQYLASSYHGGATDFISKPYRKEELQRRVLNVGRLLREQYLSKRQKLVEWREQTLSIFYWKSTVYQFNSCFSRFLQSVVFEAEALGGDLSNRFGLDPAANTDDELVQHLRSLEAAVQSARGEWAALQPVFYPAFNDDDGRDEKLIVGQLLKTLAEEVRPCMAVKFTCPLENAPRVLSFQQSVPIILKEVLVGGLSEAGNKIETWTATVTLGTEDGMAKVIFEDSFPAIPAAAAEVINKGETIAPRRDWWRAWGLSVAQHIALRGGGRLIIEPREQGGGNQITYLIPLAQHA